jgi:hypothetical protein
MMVKNIIILLLIAAGTSLSQIHKDLYNDIDNLRLVNVKAEAAEHHGKKALKVAKLEDKDYSQISETFVILENSEFKNGIIELELSGEPAPGAGRNARGFVGLAFRLQETKPHKYECFYIRPTNGRADDQVRRNHSTQYVSHPDFTWFRLRKEFPKKYESYADMAPGEWIKMKIEVSGEKAKLYLHGDEQPCLIVNDLKLGEISGKIALWLHSSTVAYYRNLSVTVTD